MATAGAVRPRVCPVPTGKEVPILPSGESGAGKKSLSWQLPVIATADAVSPRESPIHTGIEAPILLNGRVGLARKVSHSRLPALA